MPHMLKQSSYFVQDFIFFCVFPLRSDTIAEQTVVLLIIFSEKNFVN